MGDLKLGGLLNLSGSLKLSGDGGRVLVNGRAVLVVGATGTGVKVIQPPPPSSPLDDGTAVEVKTSFNQTVTVGGKNAVAQGITLQGRNSSMWPGMVLPSSQNTTVTINGVPINVAEDRAITLPNGGSATLSISGQ